MDIQRPRIERVLDALDRSLAELWQLGGSALVAWRPSPAGIRVISCPIGTLFARGVRYRRIFAGDRLMGSRTFERVAESLGVAPVEIVLPLPVAAGPGSLSGAAVERCLVRYSVMRTDHRAVFLIDIAGFSLLPPEAQAAQLATLGHAINLAQARALECGLPVDLARSTTGDGFYLWNRHKGPEPDAALFAVFALALGHHAALQRGLSPHAVPAIRCAFGIGSHYTYHRRDGLTEGTHDYIVGNITISLARLIERAARNQILIADFARPGICPEQAAGPVQFVAGAGEWLARVTGTELAGGRILGIAAYLTGPRSEVAGYGVRRLTVVDKHGQPHSAFNAKINIRLSAAEPVYLGLPDHPQPVEIRE